MLFAIGSHGSLHKVTRKVISSSFPLFQQRSLHDSVIESGRKAAWRPPFFQTQPEDDEEQGNNSVNRRSDSAKHSSSTLRSLHDLSKAGLDNRSSTWPGEANSRKEQDDFAIRSNIVTASPFESQASERKAESTDTVNSAPTIQSITHNKSDLEQDAHGDNGTDIHPSSTTNWTGKIGAAIAANNSSALLSHVWEASKDADFIASIPGVTFAEILRRVQPDEGLLPLHYRYKSLGPKHYVQSTWARQELYKMVQRKRRMYQDIFENRMKSGMNISHGEFTSMLNITRVLWDGRGAQNILRTMLSRHVEPDVTCYNHYFEARCWSDALVPEERHALRVIPLNVDRRSKSSTRETREGYKIEGHDIGEKGIRWEVSRLFQKITDEGRRGDLKTYMNLITAQAREGDLQGVKSVLRHVWNVDIDALLAGRAVSAYVPTIDEDSPRYPNEELLFVLAHAFGSNNDVPTALRVVAHVSELFGIRIPELVWAELLEWTFVLTRYRNETRKFGGADQGQLPAKSMENLWNVMQGEAYQIKPDMQMYDLMIRHHWREDHLHKMMTLMREGLAMHNAKFGEDESFLDEYENRKTLAKSDLAGTFAMAMDSSISEERSSKWLSFVMIHRWFRLLLSGTRYNVSTSPGRQKEDRVYIWQRQMIPLVIDEFWRFRSHMPLRYGIRTGWVMLMDTDDMMRRFHLESSLDSGSAPSGPPDEDDDANEIMIDKITMSDLLKENGVPATKQDRETTS